MGQVSAVDVRPCPWPAHRAKGLDCRQMPRRDARYGFPRGRARARHRSDSTRGGREQRSRPGRICLCRGLARCPQRTRASSSHSGGPRSNRVRRGTERWRGSSSVSRESRDAAVAEETPSRDRPRSLSSRRLAGSAVDQTAPEPKSTTETFLRRVLFWSNDSPSEHRRNGVEWHVEDRRGASGRGRAASARQPSSHSAGIVEVDVRVDDPGKCEKALARRSQPCDGCA